MGPLLIIVLGVVVIGGIAYGAYLHNKKHRELLADWAAAKGWSYTARDDTFAERWSGTPFGTGHSRKAQNVMAGKMGSRPAVAFDYQYNETTYNGQTTQETTYRFSVYALALPCALPQVSVGPEGFFSKIGHAVGVHDVQLESEQFNRAFRVTADGDKLAYDLLPARSMELLLTQPDVHLRTAGATLLCFDKRWLDPRHIEARLALMAGFLDNVPSFVWHDHGAA